MSYSEVNSGNQRQAGNLQCLPCSPDGRYQMAQHRCTQSLTLIIQLAMYLLPPSPPSAQPSRPTSHPSTHLSNTLLTYIWASMKREQMWRTKRTGKNKQRAFNAIE